MQPGLKILNLLRSIRFWLSFITILAVVGVAIFIVWPGPLKQKLDTEVFRLTYQFLLIGILGGVVSLLYKGFESEREQALKQKERDREQALRQKEDEHARRDARRRLQREFHSEFIQTYNATKKVRRLLRARAGFTMTALDAESYDEQMQHLIDAQLNFEFFVYRARSNPDLFSNVSLAPDLERMEKYLNGIINEYESKFSDFAKRQETIPVDSQFSKLKEFIGSTPSAKDFKSDFKDCFHKVVVELEKLMTS